MSQFEPPSRKVHLHHDQRGAKIGTSNRRFANTLCKMNSDVPDTHITDIASQVTCKICQQDRRFPRHAVARMPALESPRKVTASGYLSLM